MKTKFKLLSALLVIVLCTSCEDNSSETNNENKITITESNFDSDGIQITKNDNGFDCSFNGNNNSFSVITNDTISGTYSIVSDLNFKSTSADELEATVNYTNEGTEYNGTNGTISIVISYDGPIEISFDITVKDSEGNELNLEGENLSIDSNNLIDNTQNTKENYFDYDSYTNTLGSGIYRLDDGESAGNFAIFLFSPGVSANINGDVEGKGDLIAFEIHTNSGTKLAELPTGEFSIPTSDENYIMMGINSADNNSSFTSDYITNGTITINKNDSSFEIIFNTTTKTEKKLIGNYSGTMEEFVEE